MKKILTLLAALALPVAAAAETYSCDTTNFGRGGWIPPKMFLEYDAKAGTASVFDGFIKSVHEAPIPAEFKRRSENSFEFRWKLRGLKASNGGKGINSYKVTLFAGRNKFTMSGRRHGYDNVISGSGTCARVK